MIGGWRADPGLFAGRFDQESDRRSERVGINYGGGAADHIARKLPLLQLGQPAAPPAYGSPVKHLEFDGVIRFVNGRVTSHSGLCQITVQGRPSYLYRAGDEWFHTDHADGVLWTLAENGIGVFRWRHERTDGPDDTVRSSSIRARRCRRCSSCARTVQWQACCFWRHGKTAIYRNVPKSSLVRLRGLCASGSRSSPYCKGVHVLPTLPAVPSRGLDVMGTFNRLCDAYFRYYETPFGLADERLQQERRRTV